LQEKLQFLKQINARIKMLINNTKKFLIKLRAWQPFRYLLSGGLAFSIDYLGFLILFYVVGVLAPLSSGISFSLGFMLSFMLQRYWVFQTKETQTKFIKKELYIYGSLAVFNLFVTSYGIKLLNDLGFEPFFGKIILILLVMLWNFVIYKKIIFKN
jgi:putative flippase GtrA